MGPRYLLLRSWLRSWGLLAVANTVLTLPARIRGRYYRWHYQRTRPPSLLIGSGGATARLAVFDAEHYVSLRNQREAAVLRCMSALVQPGQTVWDVGANVGVYTLICARLVGEMGQVVAFEPSPAAQSALHDNIRLNGMANVRVVAAALGRTSGTARLWTAAPVVAGTHRLIAGQTAAHADLLKVPLHSGDELCAAQSGALRLPNLIKIDVEGAEEEVLAGLENTLRSPCCQGVLVEVHFGLLEAAGQGEAPLRIRTFLPSCGFDRLRWLDRSHLLATKSARSASDCGNTNFPRSFRTS